MLLADSGGPSVPDEHGDARHDDSARPLFIPRALVMLSSLWVFLCWILLFGFRPPVQPQAASYGPSIQMLFLLIGVGIAIGWPLLRLSARPSSAPFAQAAIDGISIFVLMQVVVWPLRLVTSWTLARAVAIDAAMAAAIMLSAALLASTQSSPLPRRRTWAMVIAVALVLGPAMADMLWNFVWDTDGASGLVATALSSLSAPTLLARFAQPSTIDPSPTDRALVFSAFFVATAVWVIAVVALLARRKTDAAMRLDREA
ncbi:MAG: hypothetical protein DWH74_00525 [Planctomycetota bacterium]|nr:MAG: hypothetical protein DWH74_00525 [Planctomycetota bacterium]